MKAANARKAAAQWTGDDYSQICRPMRQGKMLAGKPAQTAAALDAYMKHQALRVPQIPRSLGHHMDPWDMFLFRGVSGLPGGRWPEPGEIVQANCYTAFSHSAHVAREFGSYIFRLDPVDIARGTPWMWFGSRNERREHRVPGLQDEEGEVLLPPGFFKVKKAKRGGFGGFIDVWFTPEPRYLRKGQLPMTVVGMPIVELASGHYEKFRNSRLGNRVRMRREAVAAAAAKKLGRGPTYKKWRMSPQTFVRAVAWGAGAGRAKNGAGGKR